MREGPGGSEDLSLKPQHFEAVPQLEPLDAIAAFGAEDKDVQRGVVEMLEALSYLSTVSRKNFQDLEFRRNAELGFEERMAAMTIGFLGKVIEFQDTLPLWLLLCSLSAHHHSDCLSGSGHFRSLHYPAVRLQVYFHGGIWK